MLIIWVIEKVYIIWNSQQVLLYQMNYCNFHYVTVSIIIIDVRITRRQNKTKQSPIIDNILSIRKILINHKPQLQII